MSHIPASSAHVRECAQVIRENLYSDRSLPGTYTDVRKHTKQHFTLLKELQDLFDEGALDEATCEYLDQTLGQWRDHLLFPIEIREEIQKVLAISAERGHQYQISEELTPQDCRIIKSLATTTWHRYPATKQGPDDGVLQKALALLGCQAGSLRGACMINAVINISDRNPEIGTQELHRRARQAYTDLMGTPENIPTYE